MRLLGLSERFTRKLFGSAMEIKMKEFDKTQYIMKLSDIFNRYDTKQIVKMSLDYCKIN